MKLKLFVDINNLYIPRNIQLIDFCIRSIHSATPQSYMTCKVYYGRRKGSTVNKRSKRPRCKQACCERSKSSKSIYFCNSAKKELPINCTETGYTYIILLSLASPYKFFNKVKSKVKHVNNYYKFI